MMIVIGEILFDIFPDYKRMGGAPFNFAYHMRKLGFPVRFLSRVGNDELGDEILDFLDNNAFNLNDIQIDRNRPTGTVSVDILGKGKHTFTIQENAAYDYLDAAPIRQLISETKPDLIYFGTLILRTQNNFKLFQDILNEKSPEALAFCDINLRPRCYTIDTIKTALDAANILKLNTDELEELTSCPGFKAAHKISALQLMSNHCLETIILTMGEKGSQWFTTHQGYYHGLAKPPLKIVDTVGAGDAYAAMAVAGIMKNMQIQEIIPLAADFASRMQHSGGIDSRPPGLSKI